MLPLHRDGLRMLVSASWNHHEPDGGTKVGLAWGIPFQLSVANGTPLCPATSRGSNKGWTKSKVT